MAEANKTTKETVETKKETVAKEKLVKVRIPITKDETDDVFVSVNNRTWLIQRGVEVEVPECVAKQLIHQQEMYEEAIRYEAALEQARKNKF